MKPTLVHLLPVLLCLLRIDSAVAGVYKWTDAEGRIQYSDTPPVTTRATALRLQTHTGPARVSQAVGADGGVTIYTTQWCGVCKRAKAFFKQNNVPFREWDVEKSDYGAAKFRQYGGNGVPLITVGNEKMMGFDSGRFMELWTASRAKP